MEKIALNSWLFWLTTCLLAHSKLTVLASTNNNHQNVNEGVPVYGIPPSSAGLNGGDIVPSQIEKQSTHSLRSGEYSAPSAPSGNGYSTLSASAFSSSPSNTEYSGSFSDGYSSPSVSSSDEYPAPSAPSDGGYSAPSAPSESEYSSPSEVGYSASSALSGDDSHSNPSGNDYSSSPSDTGYSAASSDGYSSPSAPSSDGYSAPSAHSPGSEYGAPLSSSDGYNPHTSSHVDVGESTQMVAEPSYGGTSQGHVELSVAASADPFAQTYSSPSGETYAAPVEQQSAGGYNELPDPVLATNEHDSASFPVPVSVVSEDYGEIRDGSTAGAHSSGSYQREAQQRGYEGQNEAPSSSYTAPVSSVGYRR